MRILYLLPIIVLLHFTTKHFIKSTFFLSLAWCPLIPFLTLIDSTMKSLLVLSFYNGKHIVPRIDFTIIQRSMVIFLSVIILCLILSFGTRMRWLGHVLRMENSRLPRKFLLSKPEIGWKRSRGGQVMTWHRGMKEATRKLAAVGQCRLPGWGPRESAHKWLSTLEDMARDRCQWRSNCNFLIDLHDS